MYFLSYFVFDWVKIKKFRKYAAFVCEQKYFTDCFLWFPTSLQNGKSSFLFSLSLCGYGPVSNYTVWRCDRAKIAKWKLISERKENHIVAMKNCAQRILVCLLPYVCMWCICCIHDLSKHMWNYLRWFSHKKAE